MHALFAFYIHRKALSALMRIKAYSKMGVSFLGRRVFIIYSMKEDKRKNFIT